MTLKLQPDPEFWSAVKITVPGEVKPLAVDFLFAWKSKSQLVEFRQRLTDGRSDEAVLAEVVRDWKGIDKPYSESALRDLIENYPASNLEILQGYLEALTESRRKN